MRLCRPTARPWWRRTLCAGLWPGCSLRRGRGRRVPVRVGSECPSSRALVQHGRGPGCGPGAVGPRARSRRVRTRCRPARRRGSRGLSPGARPSRASLVRGPRARRPGCGLATTWRARFAQCAASSACAGEKLDREAPELQRADEQHQQREDQNWDAQRGGYPCQRFGDGRPSLASVLIGSPRTSELPQRAQQCKSERRGGDADRQPRCLAFSRPGAAQARSAGLQRAGWAFRSEAL